MSTNNFHEPLPYPTLPHPFYPFYLDFLVCVCVCVVYVEMNNVKKDTDKCMYVK